MVSTLKHLGVMKMVWVQAVQMAIKKILLQCSLPMKWCVMQVGSLQDLIQLLESLDIAAAQHLVVKLPYSS